MPLPRLPFAAAVLAVALSGCAAERKPPPPVAAPPPVAPAPAPPPAPKPPADWRDAAQTPGNWTYRSSIASFGAANPLLALRCDTAARQVVLSRAGAATAGIPLAVTTTSLSRAVTATPSRSDPPEIAVALSPRDPLLDAMAFSRGRFMVEAPGLPTLYLPAWPEIGRVIEDCR